MAIPAGTRVASYEVVSLLGAGGMGEVYRARDSKLGRDVALKFLPDVFAADADRLARFRREANVLASLNNPHIAIIHGLEETQGTQPGVAPLFLVMELVDGEDLSERIGRGAVPLDEAIALAGQIADALEAAHDAGVVHRDLKPANIKVRADGNVKVLDFGLAKAVENSGANSQNISVSPTMTSPAQMTGIGVILGTAAYMSPEQAKGRLVDKRADVWAFGAVLYEMLTGRRAFEGDDVSDTLAAILRAVPDWSALPAATSPALHRLLRRCLEKDPRARLSDMAMVRLELRDAARELAEPPSSTNTTTRARRSIVSRALPFAAAIVLAAATGLAVWVLRRPVETPPAIVRFSVDLPANMQFSTPNRKHLAISGDGTILAYVADRRIFVRRLDQLDAQPIQGSEQGGTQFARAPIFSPDGASLAYWQTGQLKKSAVTGGPPEVLSPVPAIPIGMSWQSNDDILIGAGAAGILRVKADGGPLEVVVKPDNQQATFPQMLPGGDWLLFLLHAENDPADSGQIVARSMANGEQRVLVNGTNDFRFVPPGYLIYARGTSLLAHAIDPESATLRGGPVAILESLSRVASAQTPGLNFDVSGSGGLVYSTSTEQNAMTSTKLVQVSRNGTASTLAEVAGLPSYPRFSPDGSRVAYGASNVRDTAAPSDLWVIDLRRGARTRVTFSGNNRYYPIWTTDGLRLTHADGSAASNRVLITAADGSGQVEVLLDAGSRRFPTSWSPDGSILALYGSKGGLGNADRDIMTMTRKDGKPIVSSIVDTPFEERGAIFSPNGKWIAYVSNKSGVNEVVARPHTGPGPELTISVGGGQEPVWSRTGRELFYRKDRKLFVVSVTETPTSLVTSTPARVFDDPYMLDPGGAAGGVANYDVWPDGQRFIMIEEPPDTRDSTQPARLHVVVNWIEEVKKRVPR